MDPFSIFIFAILIICFVVLVYYIAIQDQILEEAQRQAWFHQQCRTLAASKVQNLTGF